MREFIYIVILTSLFSAFCLTVAKKWGIIEFIQVKGNKFFSKMANCDFCLSFWTSLGMSIVVAIITGNAIYLFCPLFSTPINKLLL